MKWSSFNQAALGSLIGLAVLPQLQPAAQAIVINDNAGAETALLLGAPFLSVPEIFLGGFSCTGALIAPTYVVTAQHCTSGISTNEISVQFRDIDPLNSLLFTKGVTAKFEVDDSDDLLDGTDLAILELDSPVTTINPLRFIAEEQSLIGQTATTVGFGWNGLGSIGHENTSDGLRWATENVIDLYGPAAFEDGFTEGANIFSTDFDDGTVATNTLAGFGSSATPLVNEGTTAPGDSGGPLLINWLGEFLIAGVLSGGTSANSQFGDISWWTGTNQHRSFIEARGGQFVSFQQTEEVPEPSALLSLLAIGAIGIGSRRSRKG